MAIAELERKMIEKWCRTRVPEEHQDEVKVVAEFRGNSATIVDARSPCDEELGPEWTRVRVAKLTRDLASGRWKLFARDRNDKLLHYSDEFKLGPHLSGLLEELERDPTCIFWG